MLRLPLSDYLRYEPAWPVPAVLARDFWAFDLHTSHPAVWLMNYDTEGRSLGSEPPGDPWPVDFVELGQIAWSWAVPLERFMREHAPARASSWEHQHRHGLSRNQQRIAQLEASASVIRSFQVDVVPGVLQTAAYARGHRLW